MLTQKFTKKQLTAFRRAIDTINHMAERHAKYTHSAMLDQLASVTYKSDIYQTFTTATKSYIDGYADAMLHPFGYNWEGEKRHEYMVGNEWMEHVPDSRWSEVKLSRTVWKATGVVWDTYGDK